MPGHAPVPRPATRRPPKVPDADLLRVYCGDAARFQPTAGRAYGTGSSPTHGHVRGTADDVAAEHDEPDLRALRERIGHWLGASSRRLDSLQFAGAGAGRRCMFRLMEGRLLLKRCSIFRADGRVRADMAVVVENGRITRIAQDDRTTPRGS